MGAGGTGNLLISFRSLEFGVAIASLFTKLRFLRRIAVFWCCMLIRQRIRICSQVFQFDYLDKQDLHVQILQKHAEGATIHCSTRIGFVPVYILCSPLPSYLNSNSRTYPEEIFRIGRTRVGVFDSATRDPVQQFC